MLFRSGILHGAADLGIRIEGYESRMRPRQEALVPSGPSRSGPAPSGSVPAGVDGPDAAPGSVAVDAPRLYSRVKALARAQSADVAARLAAEGVEVIAARGKLTGPHTVLAGDREITAGVVLLATGGLPRQLPGAEPDGERILNWRHLYDLDELPSELIVVGSGVTGAEFASAYQAWAPR